MGRGYTLRCRKCGWEISANLGVGFMFPMIYQETMKAARAGEYGETIRRFLEEHPDGVLNAENVLLQCIGCGDLECGPELSMYIRKQGVPRGEKGIWSVAMPLEGAGYVSPMELKEQKTFEFHAWGNVCGKCGKLMKPVSDQVLSADAFNGEDQAGRTKVPCPECREPLWIEDILMWD